MKAAFGIRLGLVIGLFLSWTMLEADSDQAIITMLVAQVATGTLVAAVAEWSPPFSPAAERPASAA